MRKNEQLIGASEERKAILRKLRRIQRAQEMEFGYSGSTIDSIVEWLLKRHERYELAPGGLGRKRKGV